MVPQHFFSTQYFGKYYDIVVFCGKLEKIRIGTSKNKDGNEYYKTIFRNDNYLINSLEPAVKLMLLFTHHELINLCKVLKDNDPESFALVHKIIQDVNDNLKKLNTMVY